MQHLAKTFLVTAAVVGLTFLTGSSFAQGGDKPEKAPQGREAMREARAKERAAHMAAIAKAMPTLKTSLPEAIAIAEKEHNGKAQQAVVELTKSGEPRIEVRLLVGEKFEEVYVDHVSKKVTVPDKKEGDEEEHEHRK